LGQGGSARARQDDPKAHRPPNGPRRHDGLFMFDRPGLVVLVSRRQRAEQRRCSVASREAVGRPSIMTARRLSKPPNKRAIPCSARTARPQNCIQKSQEMANIKLRYVRLEPPLIADHRSSNLAATEAGRPCKRRWGSREQILRLVVFRPARREDSRIGPGLNPALS